MEGERSPSDLQLRDAAPHVDVKTAEKCLARAFWLLVRLANVTRRTLHEGEQRMNTIKNEKNEHFYGRQIVRDIYTIARSLDLRFKLRHEPEL